ncbi:hypothetical protein ACFOPQ_05205 [Deinococcus antarcticus]|uniref:Uncharacterized protein n=1 Tax=Deinococcus antarcticus TaxID=1298767 RepID=A0ABV8A4J7_9DEIO
MKRSLLLLTLLAGMGHAAAADEANCATMLLTGTSLSYTTKGVFPASPQQKDFDFLDDDSPAPAQKACGLTFTPDRKAGALTISGASFKPFSQLLGHLAPASAKTQLDISNNLGMATQHVYFDPAKRLLSFKGQSTSVEKLVVAVKIDGGPLKPLFYSGKVTPITYLAGAQKVDVYFSADKAFVLFWQRASINLKSPSITIFEKAAMPSK